MPPDGGERGMCFVLFVRGCGVDVHTDGLAVVISCVFASSRSASGSKISSLCLVPPAPGLLGGSWRLRRKVGSPGSALGRLGATLRQTIPTTSASAMWPGWWRRKQRPKLGHALLAAARVCRRIQLDSGAFACIAFTWGAWRSSRRIWTCRASRGQWPSACLSAQLT